MNQDANNRADQEAQVLINGLKMAMQRKTR